MILPVILWHQLSRRPSHLALEHPETFVTSMTKDTMYLTIMSSNNGWKVPYWSFLAK